MIWGVKKTLNPPPNPLFLVWFNTSEGGTMPPIATQTRRIRVLSKRRFPTDSRAPSHRRERATCLDGKKDGQKGVG